MFKDYEGNIIVWNYFKTGQSARKQQLVCMLEQKLDVIQVITRKKSKFSALVLLM